MSKLSFSFRSTWNGRALREKPPQYWVRIILLILLGMLASRWLEQFRWWRRASYSTYGLLLKASQSAPSHPAWTAVVFIDDTDYWRGDWARRTPLKRSMVAVLLRRIHEASPRAIGLDVDLRAQVPDGSVSYHPDYASETAELLTAIREVSSSARGTPIVLAKTIDFDVRRGQYVLDADIFDRLQLGPRVSSGYTRLPRDVRNLALSTTVGGRKVDSFAMAIARFVDAKAVATAERRGGGALPYSMFLPEHTYRDSVLTARQVLDPRSDLSALRNRVVIIGGNWHRSAAGRGELIDEHLTPVGGLAGALVHANYVEAVLAQRTFSPSFHAVHAALEFVLGVGLAAIFVSARGTWKLVYVAATGVIVALISVMAWQNLGTFFDGVPPLILLAGHAVFETVMDWKEVHDSHVSICEKTATGGQNP